MIPSPYWKEWYSSQHAMLFATLTGDEFEGYVTAALEVAHDDFINPEPAGRMGDRKCDGLANAGKLFYACYGSRPEPGSTEAALVAKMTSDLTGALAKWPTFEEWRFVTNARTGPDCSKFLITAQAEHGPESGRPVSVRLWKSNKLWNELISELSQDKLNHIYPGAPGVADVDLNDLLPLIDALNSVNISEEPASVIREVPPNKMDFNRLSAGRRLEMNSGRRKAPRIDAWYEGNSDPSAYDQHGARFRALYQEHSGNHSDSDEIVEALYESLAGPGFRRDSTLANSVYTVTAYFFDSCHIFETPEEQEGSQDALAN